MNGLAPQAVWKFFIDQIDSSHSNKFCPQLLAKYSGFSVAVAACKGSSAQGSVDVDITGCGHLCPGTDRG